VVCLSAATPVEVTSVDMRDETRRDETRRDETRRDESVWCSLTAEKDILSLSPPSDRAMAGPASSCCWLSAFRFRCEHARVRCGAVWHGVVALRCV
jgi:hypothetical protein